MKTITIAIAMILALLWCGRAEAGPNEDPSALSAAALGAAAGGAVEAATVESMAAMAIEGGAAGCAQDDGASAPAASATTPSIGWVSGTARDIAPFAVLLLALALALVARNIVVAAHLSIAQSGRNSDSD